MCADYCPVPDMDGVCKYEDRDEAYIPTPKGCFYMALCNHVDDIDIDKAWNDFNNFMDRYGYIQHEESMKTENDT
jgi:hypothetical protein